MFCCLLFFSKLLLSFISSFSSLLSVGRNTHRERPLPPYTKSKLCCFASPTTFQLWTTKVKKVKYRTLIAQLSLWEIPEYSIVELQARRWTSKNNVTVICLKNYIWKIASRSDNNGFLGLLCFEWPLWKSWPFCQFGGFVVNDVQRVIRCTDTAIKGRIICKLILKTQDTTRGESMLCAWEEVWEN